MMSSKGSCSLAKGIKGDNSSGDELKEDDSSGDDSDDVRENGAMSGAPNTIDFVEELKQEMFDEEDEVQAIKALSSKRSATDELDYVVNRVKNRIQVLKQDLQPFTLDGRQFCIDGDALLMSILTSKDVDHQCGGQTLHIIYLFEKYLLMFERNGLKYCIIFLEVWESFWEKFSSQIALTRNALCLHLQHNTSICVLTKKAVWENDFISYVSEQRPSFLLTSFVLPPFFSWFFCGEDLQSKQHKCSFKCQESTFRQDALKWAQFLLNAQMMFIHFMNLYVVEVGSVDQDVASLNGNVHSPNANFQVLRKKIEGMILTVMSTEEKCEKMYTDLIVKSGDVRRAVAVMSAVNLLKMENDSSTKAPKNMVQLFLLYSALIEAVPLKLRNPDVPVYTAPELDNFIKLLQKTMIIILNTLFKENAYQFKLVADIWHGRFFHFLYMHTVNFNNIDEKHVGKDICGIYNNLIASVNDAVTINAFPIEPFSGMGPQSCPTVVEINKIPELQYDSAVLLKNVIPASCELVQLFCGGIVPSEELDQCPSVSGAHTALKVFKTIKKGNFHEHRHWHNKKPLSDEYDRIKENKLEAASKFNELRHAQYLSRWNLLYGKTVVGRDSNPRTIVTQKQEKGASLQKIKKIIPQKGEKPKKMSKKQLIIEENIKKKSQEKEDREKGTMDAFLREFKALKEKGLYEKAVIKCDLCLKNLQSPKALLKVSVSKVSALWLMWQQECTDFKEMKNLSIVKKLFLTIKEILSSGSDFRNQMSPEDLKFIGMVLCNLGFAHIANCWDLPESPSDANAKYLVGETWAEFQLKYLGSKLDRNMGSVYDSRADGFMPDPWQVKLFDIIDNHQSVLVVAPTSSGKTFASYYCMEKVLQESDDGVVIYVSPTKALVNQVSATICANFRKDLPPGRTLQGSFTRDFKFNVLKCQILTTVPQALEILLLSPRMQSWVNRIQYVIFDEIHCLAGQSGGVHWERLITLIPCPFLALSATIKEPESFCKWLQSVEHFKQQRAQVDGNNLRSMNSYRVHLVKHLDRHSHLTKNIMHGDGSFQHIHPYGLLDEVILRENEGIPELLTLSPAETLELYHTMTGIFPVEAIGRLAPEVYLKTTCPTGFLSMPSVKQYVSEMRDFLLFHKSKFLDVIRALQPEYDHSETGSLFVLSKFHKLVAQLKTRDMLPALVFSYSRQLVEILPSVAVTYLEDQGSDEDSDDESISRDEKKKLFETQEVSTKSLTEKQAKRWHSNRKFAKTLDILKGGNILTSNGSLRGGGVFDETLVKHVELGLLKRGHTSTKPFIQYLRRGLGLHHGGMGTKERSAVEILFRMKMLNLVCATGTLALGIHMPCKTVVIAGDSPFLSALEYHQMSGRAGRRGFDLAGNVIFMGLRKERITSLVTGNVPKMVGNFPMSISLIVRLLLLITDATDKTGKVSQEARKLAISRAYTLVENGLIYQEIPSLKDQIKHFFAFAIQFLIYQGLLDDVGAPQIMCGLVVHVHYHTGIFAFLHLLQTKKLHELCETAGKGEYELVIVLSYLFTPMHISSFVKKNTYVNSKVFLPPLPDSVQEELRIYNKRVMNVFGHYLKCLGDHVNKISGPDVRLPLSNLEVQSPTCGQLDISKKGKVPPLLRHLGKICTQNEVCSSFASLAGRSDADIFDTNGCVSNVRHDVLPDINILPIIPLNEEYNSYALDFYVHGIKKAIIRDNGLREGYDFTKLQDIVLVVRTLYLSLEEMYGPDDCLVKTFSVIDQKFRTNFFLAYSKMVS